MPDFNVRADSVNVEQIMEQIRTRIREKRGVDYTEEQIREMAAVKLEKFLDPRGIRSDLLDQFRSKPTAQPPDLPNYAFEDATLFESHRAPVRWIRRLLQPVLKLFFNPNPLIQALHIQARLNALYPEREAAKESTRRQMDQLYYELVHNLVIETTRLGIDVKNLKMTVESLTSRLEFSERRARALESVVVYRPDEEETAPARAERPAARFQPAPASPPAALYPQALSSPQSLPSPQSQPSAPSAPSAPSPGAPEGPGQRSRRRRRRRGRRGGGGPAASVMGSGPGGSGAVTTGPGAAGDTASTADRAFEPDLRPDEPGDEGPAGNEPDPQ